MNYIKQLPSIILLFLMGCGERNAIEKIETNKFFSIKYKKEQQKTSRTNVETDSKVNAVQHKLPEAHQSAKKASKEQEKKLKPKEYTRRFLITIEGMACPVCEKSVLYHLRKIDGISNIVVHDHNEFVSEHTAEIIWKGKKNIPLGAVVDAIETEDFVLHKFSGKLRGRFVEDNGKKQFVVQGTGEPFTLTRAVGNAQPIRSQVWDRVQKDKLFWVKIIIWRDPQDGVYKIALNRAGR